MYILLYTFIFHITKKKCITLRSIFRMYMDIWYPNVMWDMEMIISLNCVPILSSIYGKLIFQQYLVVMTKRTTYSCLGHTPVFTTLDWSIWNNNWTENVHSTSKNLAMLKCTWTILNRSLIWNKNSLKKSFKSYIH